MSTLSKRIVVKDSVSKDLITRNAARDFFSSLRKVKKGNIVLDFSGIVFMSRSFADEYIIRKNNFKSSNISEVNVPDSVRKTLEAVSEAKTSWIELPKIKAQNLFM
jgi:anti-anti-sigma regulatory factor